ncbi:T9SS type A sorting domain-containing protein [Bizionia myxarmorum]|uniref:T9SS type A sorting domain-containing protein n=1 Tax=Bizionia myxarmorum TaxID=291186 RepID=A0A5D0R5E9_9FLAO|nr:T9SS type A sorting domain-containing protein [Bizionia myxarmorum]TYB75764.1 T9SS type A sorting domain-containing protein [Bizionia myxarmorum]
MKKITKFIFSSLFAIIATFSATASNNLDDVNLPNTNPDSSFTTEECYASTVVDFQQGTLKNGGIIGADRSDPSKALYQPDASNAAGGFVSLGVSGYIILGFDGVIYDQAGNDFMIYETSFAGDNCNSTSETALIELSQDGITWVTYGEICLDEAIDFSGLGLNYVSQIKVTNTANTPDGYDLDGVIAINGCQELIQECYGAEVISYTAGLTNTGVAMTNPSRINPAKALGQPQGNQTENFVSLGFGGEVVIGFDGVVKNEVGNDLIIFETTFGNKNFSNYPESADVYISQNGVDFYLLGSVLTSEFATFDIDNALTPTPLTYITQVKLIDTTPTNSISDDGFDLDGIIAINGCSEPENVVFARCSAYEVLEYNEGTTRSGGTVNPIRTQNPNNVLGYPEGTDEYGVFTTLGYGGNIVLSFEGAVENVDGDDLRFIETSFNQSNGCGAYPEFADIYVSFDGFSWHMAGTVCKENNSIDISDAGNFEYINFVKVVNNDTLSTTPDGYDLDGVIIIGTCDESLSVDDQVFASKPSMDVKVYPNPVVDSATVRFTASENGKAGIEVYDSYGRAITTLFKGDVFAGEDYKVEFKTNNLPNGIYIGKITNNNVTKTIKIVVSR